MNAENLEAVQAVVDRVNSWQETAPEGTVEQELRSGLQEAGVSLDDAEVVKLADAIKEQDGEVDAGAVLS